MKVVVNSYDLAEAVNKVSKAVATKDINGKILEGIKLVAKNDKLTLTAYDSEMSIETTIKCETLVDGEMVVAGKIFAEYVNKVATENGEVEINEQENGQAKITCGKVKFALSTMNAKEFPLINTAIQGNVLDIEVAEFKRLVNQTSFCAAQDDARPILKGCLLETVEENELSIYAVDGFRLAKSVGKANSVQGTIKCVVLARALNEMVKLIGAEEKSVKIFSENNLIMLKTGETILTARLLVGQFIDSARLLSSPYDKTIIANREELISALDRMSILAKTANNLITVKAIGNTLYLNANTEIGNIEEELEVEKLGKDIQFALNYKYLLDILKAINEEEIKLCAKEETTPLFIRSDIENGTFDYLVMPVRVGR